MATLGNENNEPLCIQSISLRFQKQETRTYTLELSCNESKGSKTTKSKLKVDPPKFSADERQQTQHRLTPPYSLSTNQTLVIHIKKKLSFFRTHLIAKESLSYSDLLRYLGETATHREEHPLYKNGKIKIDLTASANIRTHALSSPTPAPAPTPTPALPAPAPQSLFPSPSPPSSSAANSDSSNKNDSSSAADENQGHGTNSRNKQDEEFIDGVLSYIHGDDPSSKQPGVESINGNAHTALQPNIAAPAPTTNGAPATQKQASTNHAHNVVSTMRSTPNADSPRPLVASGSGAENTQRRAVAGEGAGPSSNGTRSGRDPQSSNNAQPSTGLINVSPLSQSSQHSSNNSQPHVGMEHSSNARRLTNGSSQPAVDDQQHGMRGKDFGQPPSKESQRSDATLDSSSGCEPQSNPKEDKRSTSNQQHGVESVDVIAQPADRLKRDQLLERSSGGSKDTGVITQPINGSVLPGGKTEQHPGKDKQRPSNGGRPSATKQHINEDTVRPFAGLTNGYPPTSADGKDERSANADKPPPNVNAQSINGGPQHSSQPACKSTQLPSKEKDRPTEEQPHSAQESGVKSNSVHQSRPPKTEGTSRTGKDQLHNLGIQDGVGSIDKKQSNEQTSAGNRPNQTVISSTRSGPRSIESDNHVSPSSDPISNTNPSKSSQQSRPGHPSQTRSKYSESNASKRNTA